MLAEADVAKCLRRRTGSFDERGNKVRSPQKCAPQMRIELVRSPKASGWFPALKSCGRYYIATDYDEWFADGVTCDERELFRVFHDA